MRISLIISIFTFSILKVSFGQENKVSYRIGGSFLFFQGIIEPSYIPTDGFYNYPNSYGIEAVVSKKIYNNFFFETGANLTNGHFSAKIERYGPGRFHFNELSIPFLIKLHLIEGSTTSFFITTGIYPGMLVSTKREGQTSFGWHYILPSSSYFYSSNKSLIDLYLNMGLYFPISNNVKASFSPFIKYRVLTTWLNNYYNKTHYGITVNIQLILKS